MKVIDAHTHAWGPDTDELPWTEPVLPPEWTGPYTRSDLIGDMDRIGVDQAVIVTTPLYGRGPRANEYTMRCLEAHPDRLFGVGIMPFYEPAENARTRAARIVGHDQVLGIRMHAAFTYEPIPTEPDRTADWITDDDHTPILNELVDREKALFIFPKADQLDLVLTLANRHEDLSIIVDHMAWPDEQTDPDEPPWNAFQSLAQRSNIYVKISSLPRSANEPWPYPDLHEYVRNLIEWFGPERLMLGSDYPWMDSWASYADCLNWVDTLECLSRRDRAFLSYRTFENLHL